MKWIYTVLFSFLSLAGILKDLAVYVSFKSNQEYITITMCTGRFEVDNTCKGSCYLNKQLDLVHDFEQDSDKQVPPNLKEYITYFYEEISAEIDPVIESIGINYDSNYNLKTKRGYPTGMFQPPQYC